jgi:hypothetical protein
MNAANGSQALICGFPAYLATTDGMRVPRLSILVRRLPEHEEARFEVAFYLPRHGRWILDLEAATVVASALPEHEEIAGAVEALPAFRGRLLEAMRVE